MIIIIIIIIKNNLLSLILKIKTYFVHVKLPNTVKPEAICSFLMRHSPELPRNGYAFALAIFILFEAIQDRTAQVSPPLN